ncbi:MAG: amidohydrolase [Planctomycetota bacterium]
MDAYYAVGDAQPNDSETENTEGTTDGGANPEDDSKPLPAIVTNYPLGAYGVDSLPDLVPAVLFRRATVWTCGESGILTDADVLVRAGKIVDVGAKLEVGSDVLVINAKGKHLTPGLIDCHSHMGTDGGVNESGQAVTAEVRIGDFIDNSDIEIYRQLAGGLTTSNILHGSANPIGGQNQVIKLRWGATMDGLRFAYAPKGIKFALGENVKRSTSRYPNTRMGVEQILSDQLLAAREYITRWNRWNSGIRDALPPRRDLQLEALAEIQRGERWIHCHSYRQDEIVATLDVLDRFGIRIGTLQHILEGYKVADRIAQHGAMASAFSDWWAYKFEVFDAIPYNGVLMHDAGIVVSFNSDDRELARHLNTEAAKATKYGGVPPEEALKFVTLNPAKQLRIDHRVGSIESGKDADLVLWSGPPMSTTSRCEQTWIDGRKYFDVQIDQQRRQRDRELRQRLIRMILDGDEETEDNSSQGEPEEEERWVRYDEYCNARGGEAGQQETNRE